MTEVHDPDPGGYMALRRGAAVVAGAHDLVWVAGSDAVDFLDNLLSQSISSIGVGRGARSLLLSPQGKMRATLWVLKDADRIGLVTDAGRGEVVIGDLTRFRIRVDVSLTLEDRPVVDVWGPGAAAALETAGVNPPGLGEWIDTDGLMVASVPFTRSALPRFVVAGVPIDDLERAGLPVSGRDAAVAVRIEAGEPVMGIDIDERTIPQEADVVADAVDFEKGCYLGQELLARIDSRGRVNRHLRGLVIDSTVVPPVGSKVFSADRALGELSSVGESHELGAPVALALLRREAEPDHQVSIRWDGGSASARVVTLPLDESL